MALRNEVRHTSVLLAAIALTTVCWADMASAQDSPADQARAAIRVKNFQQAVVILKPAATAGDAQAKYLLAGVYRSGFAGHVDDDVIRQLYAQAAAQGFSPAAYSYATLLADTAEHDENASEFLSSAIAGGYAPAKSMQQLGGLPARSVAGANPTDAATQRSALWNAIATDNLPEVQVAVYAAQLNAVDEFGRTALAHAAAHGADRVTRWLLKRGARPDLADHFGATPLMLGAYSGSVAVVNDLLSVKPALDIRDSVGNTAVFYAVRAKNVAIVDQLLQSGADASIVNAQGATAMDAALRNQATAVVAALNAHGVSSGSAATTTAAPLVPLLRASASVTDAYAGMPDLVVAATRRSPDLLTAVLMQSHADLALQSDAAMTIAVASGSSPTLARLVATGALKQSAMLTQNLETAIRRDNVAMAEQLLTAGASAGARGRSNVPLVVIAARHCGSAPLNLLIKRGADATTADASGMTALMAAAASGHSDCVRLLLDSGVPLEPADKAGRTALWFAAAANCTRCVEQLLRAGAPAARPDAQGLTALAMAAQRGSVAAVDLLLKAGASAQATTSNGSTPLMLAVAAGNEAVVQRLLSTHPSLDAQNQFGDTPLIIAARTGNPRIVQLLIRAGADRDLRNQDRASARDVAKSLGLTEVNALLKS